MMKTTGDITKIKEYFNDKEWKIIQDICNNIYDNKKIMPFIIQCKKTNKSNISFDAFMAQLLKVDKEKLLKFIVLFYWHESPLQSSFKDFNMKRKVAIELAGLNEKYNEWADETPKEIVEFATFFTKLMNPIIFRNIMKNLEICESLHDQDFSEIEPKDLANALKGREKLMEFSATTMDSIKNYFSENAEKGAYSFQLAMVREDRFTLPERFLVNIGEIFGINENPLLYLRKQYIANNDL